MSRPSPPQPPQRGHWRPWQTMLWVHLRFSIGVDIDGHGCRCLCGCRVEVDVDANADASVDVASLFLLPTGLSKQFVLQAPTSSGAPGLSSEGPRPRG